MLGPGIEAPGTALWEPGTRTEATPSPGGDWGARNGARRAGSRKSPFQAPDQETTLAGAAPSWSLFLNA